MLGTVLSQAIPVIMLPILTKLVTPNVLGEYFEWYSISLICGVITLVALDNAIYTASTRSEVIKITMAVTTIASGVIAASGIAALAFYVFNWKLMHLGAAELAACGMYAGISAVTQCVMAGYVFDGRFAEQAYAKVIFTALPSIIQAMCVLVGALTENLILGQIVGMTIALASIANKNRLPLHKYVIKACARPQRMNLSRWRRFPLIALPSSLINNISAQSPILFLGHLYGPDIAAKYAIAFRTIAVPIGLMSTSILTVFKRDASYEFRHFGHCEESYWRTAKILAGVSMVILLSIFLFGESIIILIYGSEYKLSVDFLFALLPSISIGFISSNLSFSLYIAQKQHWELYWQILLLTSIIISLSFASSYIQSIRIYSITYSVLYLVYLYLSWMAARSKR